MFEANLWNTWIQITGRIWYTGTKIILRSFRQFQIPWSTESPASNQNNAIVIWQVVCDFFLSSVRSVITRGPCDTLLLNICWLCIYSDWVTHGFQCWFWIGLFFRAFLHLLHIFVINTPSLLKSIFYLSVKLQNVETCIEAPTIFILSPCRVF